MTTDRAADRAAGPRGGLLAVVAAAAIWGTTGTATHFAPGVPAFVFGAVTFGLGGIVMAATAWRPTRRALADRRIRGRILLGALGLAVFAVVFYAALAGAGVALGTTISIGASPAFAGLIEWATAGRPVTRRWVTATVVGVAGMAVVTIARAGAGTGTGGPGSVGPSLVLGVLCALAAGFTYALYTWAVADALGSRAAIGEGLPAGAEGPVAPGPDRPEARGVVGAVFALAAAPLVVVAAVFGSHTLAEAANWPVFLYLALVPTVLGHTLYAVGLRTVSASVATLLSLLEPVVAAVLAVLVVGEQLGAVGWAGVALVVVGLGILAVPARVSARGAGRGPSAGAPSR